MAFGSLTTVLRADLKQLDEDLRAAEARYRGFYQGVIRQGAEAARGGAGGVGGPLQRSLKEAAAEAERQHRRVVKAVRDAEREVNQTIRDNLRKTKQEREKAAREAEESLRRSVTAQKQLLSDASRAATVAGAAIAAGLGLAAKTAISFESAFAGVRKTVDASEAEFAALEKRLRTLATTELPLPFEEIARIAELGGQLGIGLSGIEDFTTTVAKLGVTTNLTTEAAATGLARIANIMRLSSSDFNALGSTIVDLGNNFATTEREIVEFTERLAPSGRVVGATTADVLAISAALASTGVEAEAGGTAFSKLFRQLATASATGGKALERFATIAGQTNEQFAALFARDPGKAVEAFIEGLARMREEGQNLFPVLRELGIVDERQTRAVLALAGAQGLLTKSMDLSRKAWKEQTALTEEARKRFETTESQLRLLTNEFREMGAEIGTLLLPHIRNLANSLRDLIRWFDDLSPAGKDAVVAITAISAAVLLLGGRVFDVVTKLKLLRLATEAIGTAQGVAGAAGAGGAAAGGAAAGVAARGALRALPGIGTALAVGAASQAATEAERRSGRGFTLNFGPGTGPQPVFRTPNIPGVGELRAQEGADPALRAALEARRKAEREAAEKRLRDARDAAAKRAAQERDARLRAAAEREKDLEERLKFEKALADAGDNRIAKIVADANIERRELEKQFKGRADLGKLLAAFDAGVERQIREERERTAQQQDQILERVRGYTSQFEKLERRRVEVVREAQNRIRDILRTVDEERKRSAENERRLIEERIEAEKSFTRTVQDEARKRIDASIAQARQALTGRVAEAFAAPGQRVTNLGLSGGTAFTTQGPSIQDRVQRAVLDQVRRDNPSLTRDQQEQLAAQRTRSLLREQAAALQQPGGIEQVRERFGALGVNLTRGEEQRLAGAAIEAGGLGEQEFREQERRTRDELAQSLQDAADATKQARDNIANIDKALQENARAWDQFLKDAQAKMLEARTEERNAIIDVSTQLRDLAARIRADKDVFSRLSKEQQTQIERLKKLKPEDVPLRGARRHGGPVGPFGAYLVGEKGPEIFEPKRAGRITTFEDAERRARAAFPAAFSPTAFEDQAKRAMAAFPAAFRNEQVTMGAQLRDMANAAINRRERFSVVPKADQEMISAMKEQRLQAAKGDTFIFNIELPPDLQKQLQRVGEELARTARRVPPKR